MTRLVWCCGYIVQLIESCAIWGKDSYGPKQPKHQHQPFKARCGVENRMGRGQGGFFESSHPLLEFLVCCFADKNAYVNPNMFLVI